MHYRALVRLAALLVRDTPTAEEVVQDAFVAMHGGWQRLRDAEKALAYLRQAVVNRSRSVLRHRTVVDKNLQKAPPDMPSAEHGAMVLLERHAVVAALRDLPERQREAIVLRYYADLSEAEIAATMGISRGAVKSHTARGMTRPPRGPGAGVMARSGRDGTPPPGHDFGDFLRQALHAAADQVEPRPDGLERIRERVGSGPVVRQQAFRAAAGAALGGFLAHLIRRWNPRRGGPSAHGSSAHGRRPHPQHQSRDWRDGLLRSALAGGLRRVRRRHRPGGGPAAPGHGPARPGGGDYASSTHSSSATQGVSGTGNPLSSSAGGLVRAASPAAGPARLSTTCSPSPRRPPRRTASTASPSATPAATATSPASSTSATPASSSTSPSGSASATSSASATATGTATSSATTTGFGDRSAKANTSATGSRRPRRPGASAGARPPSRPRRPRRRAARRPSRPRRPSRRPPRQRRRRRAKPASASASGSANSNGTSTSQTGSTASQHRVRRHRPTAPSPAAPRRGSAGTRPAAPAHPDRRHRRPAAPRPARPALRPPAPVGQRRGRQR